MRIDGHLSGKFERAESWEERLMETIELRTGGVFLGCWDAELVAGEHDGEVVVVGWGHAEVGDWRSTRMNLRSAGTLPHRV